MQHEKDSSSQVFTGKSNHQQSPELLKASLISPCAFHHDNLSFYKEDTKGTP
jgi:hypothetical protein